MCVDTVVSVYNFPLNDKAQGTKKIVGGFYDAFFLMLHDCVQTDISDFQMIYWASKILFLTLH